MNDAPPGDSELSHEFVTTATRFECYGGVSGIRCAVVLGTDSIAGPTTVDTGNLGVLGAITGTGGVTVNSGGIVGAVTPTALAGTTVTINVDNGLALTNPSSFVGGLAGSGALSVTGSLTVGGDNASSTYSGLLSGGGGLIKSGTGNFTLANSLNSYSGGTQVSGGYLAIPADGTLGNIAGGLTLAGGSLEITANAAIGRAVTIGSTGATITTDTGATATLSGTIIDTGPLTKEGAGDLTISGPVTTTAPATVNLGTLTLGGSFSDSGGIVINGLQAGVFGTGTPGSATNLENSTVTVNDYGQLNLQSLSVATLGGLAGNIGAVVRLPGVSLSVGLDGANTTYSGALTGSSVSSFTKTGSGTFTLTGDDSNYGGSMTVNGGTLLVNSTVNLYFDPGLVVGPGAALGGTGQINGPVTVAGTLLAGPSGSTPLVIQDGSSSLSFASTGVMAVQLGIGMQNSGHALGVTGGVDLTSATVSLSLAPGYIAPVGATFDLIEVSTGGHYSLDEPFSNLPNGGTILAGAENFGVTYTSSDVILTALPSVGSVQVNDGLAQRSEVTSITVTFNGPFTFAGDAAAAFQLAHISDPVLGGLTGHFVTLTASTPTTNAQNDAVVTLTFSGAETDPDSANAIQNDPGLLPSLADGRYQLTVFAADITGTGTIGFAGGGADGDYVSATDTQGGGPGQLRLYRLFGDVDGNGVVDQLDLAAFRAANGSSLAVDPLLYKWFLDNNDDDSIDQLDLAQFRARNNSSVF